MDPVTWAKTKGPAYIGSMVGATICAVLMIALAVPGMVDSSYEPIIEPIVLAAPTILLAVAAMQFDKSDNGSHSA
jgi:hypothetical protein